MVEDTEEVRANLKQAFWMSVFSQLVESPRFLLFLEANYLVTQEVNEEAKTIDTKVIEKPVAALPVTGEQVFKMHALCMQAGAREPRKLLEALLNVLGQPDKPLLEIADEATLQQVISEKKS